MDDSHEVAKARSLDEETISSIVVNCGYQLHVEAGPRLLETVYKVARARLLEDRRLQVRRQVPVPINILGMTFDEGFRADLVVNDCFLIELKSVEKPAPVHSKQTLTYLRLLKFPLGFLINFGNSTFKEGCKRIVNDHKNLASCLRVNQNERKEASRG